VAGYHWEKLRSQLMLEVFEAIKAELKPLPQVISVNACYIHRKHGLLLAWGLESRTSVRDWDCFQRHARDTMILILAIHDHHGLVPPKAFTIMSLMDDTTIVATAVGCSLGSFVHRLPRQAAEEIQSARTMRYRSIPAVQPLASPLGSGACAEWLPESILLSNLVLRTPIPAISGSPPSGQPHVLSISSPLSRAVWRHGVLVPLLNPSRSEARTSFVLKSATCNLRKKAKIKPQDYQNSSLGWRALPLCGDFCTPRFGQINQQCRPILSALDICDVTFGAPIRD
jgi:hypothetical protein